MAKAKDAPDGVFGAKIFAGLKGVVKAAKAGGLPEVKKRFTVRQVKRAGFAGPELSPADVAAIRKELGVSQAVFAALLGVAPNTVRAWEQGTNVLSGMARRFLAEIRGNVGYWKERISEACR